MKHDRQNFWFFLSSGLDKHQHDVGGLHSTKVTKDSVLASHPAAPGSILGVPKTFSLDVA